MSAHIAYANSRGDIVLTIPIAVNIYDYSEVELKLRKIFMLEHLADTIKSLSSATLKTYKDDGYRAIAYLARMQRKAIKLHIAKIDQVLKGKV